MRCLSLFGERIDAMLDAVPYGRFASFESLLVCFYLQTLVYDAVILVSLLIVGRCVKPFF